MKKLKVQGTGGSSSKAPGQVDIMAGEGGLNLKRMLSLKADKEDLEKIHLAKCSKMDSEVIKDVQNIMCKQFKHILILFVEIVNC